MKVNGEKKTEEYELKGRRFIFSDGIETDFLKFNSGAKVDIGIAEPYGLLVE
jgi:hypothetical protein